MDNDWDITREEVVEKAERLCDAGSADLALKLIDTVLAISDYDPDEVETLKAKVTALHGALTRAYQAGDALCKYVENPVRFSPLGREMLIENWKEERV